MSPTWTILIPTLGQRSAELKRLLDVLLPQTEPYSGRVQVVALWNNGEIPIATIRQTLLMSAQSSHISFIDDDDLVPAYYVRDIMRALEYDVDYVGWVVEIRYPERGSQLAYHSLQYGEWYTRDQKLYRDITHTNVMRTSIAKTADFRQSRRYKAEDRIWSVQLRKSRLLVREVYIDRIMYYYLYDPKSSDTWRDPRRVHRNRKFTPLQIDHPNFTWYRGEVLHDHPGSSGLRSIDRVIPLHGV